MEERRILSNMRHTSGEVARVSFTTVRKNGFDPQEVRTYLEGVAREMAQFEKRIRDLHDQLAEANHRAAHPSFDEATLTTALGSQSAAILRSAHDEAGRVTAEAQERASATYAEAQKRAALHLIDTQERITVMLTDAEQTATSIDQEARAAAERLVESAKVNGESIVERARAQGRAIVEQATEARRATLNDLAVKRKALAIQIEQLRGARDSLAATMVTVRESIDHSLTTLVASDEQARHAALDALRLRPATPEPTEEELLANTPLRAVPDVPGEPAPPPIVASKPSTEATADTPVSSPAPVRAPSPAPDSFVEVDPGATDVVNDIFARLRKATLEERGASAPTPKKVVVAASPETPTEELFARRDKAVSESLSALTRKVKRALQDDQNVMLDRLRDVTGDPTEELEDELAQRARYAEAAVGVLAESAQAGRTFAFQETGAQGADVDEQSINDCAADLAVTIVLALRKRIMADGNGDASDRANAAYKEWRGARVERLCTDAARRAFHVGVTAAATGRGMKFLPAPTDAPCDACALDAQAPPRATGQAFPSGSLYPPLHAGCACTVIPV